MGRHAWDPEHVRLRKMGAPVRLVSEGNATGGGSVAGPTFMMHPTSGRTGFADLADQRSAPIPPLFSGLTVPNKANEAAPIMFGMAHMTSGRQGFAPAGAPPGASVGSALSAFGFQPPSFPSIFGAGGAPPPPSA